VITAILAVAWLSTIAMLLGVFTRATHAVSVVATMAIAAYAVSGSATWSHTDVPPVLASLALLGARSGDALSIDAWRRARRRKAAPATDYQASVRLVQLAVAAVFVLGCYEKIRAGGLSPLAWALSDSLRHHLLAWYDASSLPRTPVANWLLGAAWRYELFALVSMTCQVFPALAVIFVRRPWLRAIAGMLWCSEIIGLGLVMRLWNLPWLPLVAVFINWDALAIRFGAATGAESPIKSRGRLAFVTGFVVFFALQAFWLNQRLHAYPFSGFPLFASVRAKRPYSRHQSYEFVAGSLDAIGANNDPALTTWLAQRAAYRAVWGARGRKDIELALTLALRDAQTSWPGAGITKLRLWLSIFQAPAYPAPARIDRLDIAVLGELDRGAFRSALGTLLPDSRTWIAPPTAPALAGMTLFAIRNDNPEPIAVAATATAGGFVLAEPLRGDPLYLIGRVPGAGAAWLLAYRTHRGY
jgi:hypothetical protein